MSAGIRNKALQGLPLNDIEIIDFHVHLGNWTRMYIPATVESMLSAMDRVGVDKVCINGVLFPDIREGNNAVAVQAEKHPDRIIPIAALNPYQGDMIDELKRCVFEHGMKGVKIHSIHQEPYSPDIRSRPREWDKVWEFCGEAKLPILYHGIVCRADIKSHPDTIFVKAHGLGDLMSLKEIACFENVLAETCSTQNTPWALKKAVEILGAERILWGTDAPLDDFAQRLGLVLDSKLSRTDQEKILGLNARRLLRLQAAQG
jgi:predicted TIM-barrel fold metal-dependent hydrolase